MSSSFRPLRPCLASALAQVLVGRAGEVPRISAGPNGHGPEDLQRARSLEIGGRAFALPESRKFKNRCPGTRPGKMDPGKLTIPFKNVGDTILHAMAQSLR